MTIWQPALSEDGPVYLAITRALEADIRSGALLPGDRLPTHRELATRLGVNVGTVSRAYAEARRRGLLQGSVGRGTFVKRPGGLALTPHTPIGVSEGLIDLSINLPLIDPSPDFSASLRALAQRRDLGELMGYGDPAGSERVRVAASRFFERLGVRAAPDEIVVCAGAQHALLVALASIVGPGEPVLAEALTYPGFVGVARLLGLRVLGVDLDEHGLVPKALEAHCRSERPRALYCMPSLQNPTTAKLSPERVERIASLAREHDLTIIEDDVQGSVLARAGPSLAAQVPERVLSIAGVSKNFLPGLRVAFLASARERMARLSELIWSSVWMASPLGAEVAAQWIEDGSADRIAAGRREEMAVRHELARNILHGFATRSQAGAYHLWLQLPDGWKATSFCEILLSRGVAVTAAEAFLAAPGPAPAAVRVSLSSTRELADLRRGLEQIASLAASEPTHHSARL